MGLTGAFEFFFNPFVALLFEFEGEFFGAGFDDTTFVEDMNEVGDYVVEEALVVGDGDGGVVGAAQFVDAGGDDAEGVDVEAGVGFVEDGEGGVEHGHLEDFILFFLTAAEAFVDGAVGEFGGHFDDFLFLFHEFEEFGAGEGVEATVFSLFVDSGAHEVGDADAGDFDGVLEPEENAFAGADVDGHVEDVFAFVYDFALGDGVFGVACDDASKGAFAVAVGTHDGVDFADVDFKIYAFKNFFVADGGV